MKKSLRNCCAEENPGYRLDSSENVLTSELIDIITDRVGSGQILLCKFQGNLNQIAASSIQELYCKEIPLKKMRKVKAAVELGKRIAAWTEEERPGIHTPGDVARLVMSEMRYYKKEVFKVLLLDTKNRLIKIETISQGVLDASVVHPRDVFRAAILNNTSSIVLVHNHPSGNEIPSAQDIEITKNLIEAGKIMNIDVIDHIIIGDGKFLSLKEKKVI